MTVDADTLEGSETSDGATGVIKSKTIGAGEIWYVGRFEGEIVTQKSDGVSNPYDVRVRVVSPSGNAVKDKRLARDWLSNTVSDEQNSGILDIYVGENWKVEVFDRDDPTADVSEIAYVVELRRAE